MQQKGISQIVMLIGGSIILLASITGVYFYFDANNYIKLPGLGTIGLNSKCIHNDADLCKFINRAKKADYFNGSFGGTSTTTDISQRTLKSVWEIDGKKSSHIATYQDGNEQFNMITMGNTLYIKDVQDGTWWKQVQENISVTESIDTYNPKEYKRKAIEDITAQTDRSQFKKMGTEICGKARCFKYEVIDPTIVDTKEYIYFDDNEYILRKTQSEQSDGTITEMTYSYDAISIKAPVDTKEAQPGQNIMNGTTSSQEDLEYLKEFENTMKDSGQKPQENSNFEEKNLNFQAEPTSPPPLLELPKE